MTSSIFFFQAEDGIRDPLVTGVQTCALPICGGGNQVRAVDSHRLRADQADNAQRHAGRSEERRVGKECRSRWSADQEKKKTKYSGKHERHEEQGQQKRPGPVFARVEWGVWAA